MLVLLDLKIGQVFGESEHQFRMVNYYFVRDVKALNLRARAGMSYQGTPRAH